MSKGIFIEGITVEMFRNASLDAVETLLNEGYIEDVEIPRWIPCSERLPEESGRDYLVTYNWNGPSGRVYTEVEIVEFRRCRWMIGEENRVVAWRPAPEPYQERT